MTDTLTQDDLRLLAEAWGCQWDGLRWYDRAGVPLVDIPDVRDDAEWFRETVRGLLERGWEFDHEIIPLQKDIFRLTHLADWGKDPITSDTIETAVALAKLAELKEG